MAFRKPATKPKARPYATLSRLILEKISEFGEVAISSFFPAKYPEARLWRSLLGLDSTYQFRRETFSALLCRLRAQGLIQRKGTPRSGRWSITERGEQVLSIIRTPALPRADGIRRLVIFDIPERERKKRDAIRLDLLAAGFRQLQKSVWHAERPLPDDFLELLDALNVRPHVHIFSVRDYGTLKRQEFDHKHSSHDRR